MAAFACVAVFLWFCTRQRSHHAPCHLNDHLPQHRQVLRCLNSEEAQRKGRSGSEMVVAAHVNPSPLCRSAEQALPLVFALTRKRMGELYGHRKRVSAVALLNAGGVELLAARMADLAAGGRRAWAELATVQQQQQPASSN
jgi:hypothetical protein